MVFGNVSVGSRKRKTAFQVPGKGRGVPSYGNDRRPSQTWIALGAVLVGYMSYYVGALAAAGSEPWLAFMFGWPPWAILRVAAYIMLGVALARPLLSAVGRHTIPSPPARRWYITCAALLLLDVILKGLLAPFWAVLLRPCLGA